MRIALKLRRDIWEIREQVIPPFVEIGAALDSIERCGEGTVVLADGADGAGGGAPNDSTYVLRSLLARGLRDVVTGCYWDPIAVRMCQEAGEGAVIALRIGGKLGPTSGDPVDLNVKVQKVLPAAFQTAFGSKEPLGAGAWVTTAGIEIVLISERVAMFSQDAFTQFGICLTNKRVIVVKGAMHFYDSFAPLAKQVLFLAGPGTSPMDPRKVPYRNLDGSRWPLVEDPFIDLGEDVGPMAPAV